MLFAYETPSELMVLLKLVDGLLASVEMADQRGGCALVLVRHSDLDVARVRVRVPVGEDIAPCVQ